MQSQGVLRVAAPVRAEAVRLLREAITRGEFQPGERLSEAEIGTSLQVSRTTIREAFRQLETERLIEVIPGKGPVVASIGPAQAVELYDIRDAIECLAVRLFTVRHTASDLEELDEACRDLETAYASGDIHQIILWKDKFYAVLYRGARNVSLEEIAANISARVARLRYASLSVPERRQNGPGELRALVDAIALRDVDRATELCRIHVHNAAEAAASAMSKQSGADGV